MKNAGYIIAWINFCFLSVLYHPVVAAEHKQLSRAVAAEINRLTDRSATVKNNAALRLREMYRTNIEDVDKRHVNKSIRDSLIKSLADADPDVRRVIVKSLGGMPHEDTLTALRNLLTREENPRVQISLITVLGELKDDESETIILIFLNHEQIPIRIAALKALGSMGTDTANQVVIDALDDQFDGMRIISAAICAENGLTESLDLLIDNISHPTPEVRSTAVDAIGVLGRRNHIKLLRKKKAGEQVESVNARIDAAIAAIKSKSRK